LTTKRNQQGFSFIEVLVTLLFVSVSVVGLSQLQISSARYADLANRKQTALYLAEAKLETFRAYASVFETQASETKAPATANRLFDLVQSGSEEHRLPEPYYLRWTVTETGSSTRVIKKIALQVSWQDGNGAEQKLSFMTVLHRAEY